MKLALKKGGGGIGLYPGGGTDIVTGNAGGTKLTAGTAGATGIFFHGKKNKQLQYITVFKDIKRDKLI